MSPKYWGSWLRCPPCLSRLMRLLEGQIGHLFLPRICFSFAVRLLLLSLPSLVFGPPNFPIQPALSPDFARCVNVRWFTRTDLLLPVYRSFAVSGVFNWIAPSWLYCFLLWQVPWLPSQLFLSGLPGQTSFSSRPFSNRPLLSIKFAWRTRASLNWLSHFFCRE